MTPQMQADQSLAIWQAHRGFTPQERIEMLFFDFTLPPAPPLDEYEATLRIVSEQMGEAA